MCLLHLKKNVVHYHTLSNKRSTDFRFDSVRHLKKLALKILLKFRGALIFRIIEFCKNFRVFDEKRLEFCNFGTCVVEKSQMETLLFNIIAVALNQK